MFSSSSSSSTPGTSTSSSSRKLSPIENSEHLLYHLGAEYLSIEDATVLSMASKPVKTTLKRLAKRTNLMINLPYEELPSEEQPYPKSFVEKSYLYIRLRSFVHTFALGTKKLVINGGNWSKTVCVFRSLNETNANETNELGGLCNESQFYSPYVGEIQDVFLSKLESLSILNCRLLTNSTFYEILSVCESLIELKLEHCPGVNGHKIEQTTTNYKHRKLKSISMCGTGMTLPNVIKLNALFDGHLEIIDVRRTPAFNRFIVEIIHLYGLQFREANIMEGEDIDVDAFSREAYDIAWNMISLVHFQNIVTSLEVLNQEIEDYTIYMNIVEVLNPANSGTNEVRHVMYKMYKSIPAITNIDKAKIALTSVAATTDSSLTSSQRYLVNRDDTEINWNEGMVTEMQLLSCTACACPHSPIEVLQEILTMGGADSANHKWGNYNFYTTLMGAAQSSAQKKVNLLLKCNANAYSSCHNGQTALHFAMASQINSASRVVVSLITALGANYAIKYREPNTNYTLLHRAAQESSLATFRKIVRIGIDVNVCGIQDGRTALHCVIDPLVDHGGANEMTTMLHLLLSAGADVELKEYTFGDSALLHAIRTFGNGGTWDPNQTGFEDISSSIRNGQPKGIVKCLLDFGADRTVVSKEQETAISLCKNKLPKTLKVLHNERNIAFKSNANHRDVIKLLKEYESLRLRKGEDSPDKKKKKRRRGRRGSTESSTESTEGTEGSIDGNNDKDGDTKRQRK